MRGKTIDDFYKCDFCQYCHKRIGKRTLCSGKRQGYIKKVDARRSKCNTFKEIGG